MIRMRGYTALISFLTLLSVIAGYLFSKISWIGRMGINLFYKNYAFFKTWWKGALLVWIILLTLLFVQGMIQKYTSVKTAVIVHILSLVVAATGIYFTYLDFRNTLSHKLAGERFHLGAYCFWLGWIAISIFLLRKKKTDVIV
jgi:hypothetical protein